MSRLTTTARRSPNRLSDSIEQALGLGDGIVRIRLLDEDDDRIFSEQTRLSARHVRARRDRASQFFPSTRRMGACPDCTGLGKTMEVDPSLVIPDHEKSLDDGAIAPWSRSTTHHGWHRRMVEAVFEQFEAATDVPFKELPPELVEAVLYGLPEPIVVDFVNHRGRQRRYETQFEGVVNNLARRHQETDSDWSRH